MFIEDGFNFTGCNRCRSASAAFVRCQDAGSPTILGESPYPAPKGRPADASPQMASRIPPSSLLVSARGALTSLRRTTALRGFNAFRRGSAPFPRHRRQIYSPANSVSYLEAKVSDLAAISHIRRQSMAVDFVQRLVLCLRTKRYSVPMHHAPRSIEHRLQVHARHIGARVGEDCDLAFDLQPQDRLMQERRRNAQLIIDQLLVHDAARGQMKVHDGPSDDAVNLLCLGQAGSMVS